MKQLTGRSVYQKALPLAVHYTHEQYVNDVRRLVVSLRLTEAKAKSRLLDAKLVYGIGTGGYRGIIHYEGWKNGQGETPLIEIAATGEENKVQLAGTTIHELGHALAGRKNGHQVAWKAACATLGLNNAQVGQVYQITDFTPDVRLVLETLPPLADGSPNMRNGANPFSGLPGGKTRPCPVGQGTRGGKSRGTGSGSRLRKWTCSCGVIARVASDSFAAKCLKCQGDFIRCNS